MQISPAKSSNFQGWGCVEPVRVAVSGRDPFPAPVAQLDRAPDFESGGQGFESLPARQQKPFLLKHFLKFGISVDTTP